MIQRRTFIRSLLSVPPAALVALASRAAAAQQLGEGMDRSGLLDIHNEEERRVFGDLQCICGCPRESIATCTCGYASGFRGEVRAMMARGMTQEEIKAEWVRRYGPQALTVLGAIAGMGAVAVVLLRRFRRRSDEKAEAAAPVAGDKRDEYDDKLDEELKQLDNE